MMAFVLGAATGYVLGARAGRERYEQIVRTYHRIAEHPSVQSAAGVARQKVAGVVTNRIRSLRHDDAHPNGARPDGVTAASTPPVTTVPRTT